MELRLCMVAHPPYARYWIQLHCGRLGMKRHWARCPARLSERVQQLKSGLEQWMSEKRITCTFIPQTKKATVAICSMQMNGVKVCQRYVREEKTLNLEGTVLFSSGGWGRGGIHIIEIVGEINLGWSGSHILFKSVFSMCHRCILFHLGTIF